MNQLIKKLSIGNSWQIYDSEKFGNRSIFVGIFDMDFPIICAYLNTIGLDNANKIIPDLTKLMNGEWWCDEYEWSSIVAYVTSHKTHSDIEIFDKNYHNIDTQKLLDWLICRRDFLILLQEKKVIIELLREAFNKIVSDPQKYPSLEIFDKSNIPGRHAYICDDIEVVIQFNVERNEFSLTFEEFLVQIPQLADDGNPNWVYS